MDRTRRLSLTVAGVALAAAWVAPSQAGIIGTYTDRTSWTTAAGAGLTTETFSGGPLASGLTTNTGVVNGALYGEGLPTVFPTNQRDLLGFTPGVLSLGGDWDLSPGGAGAGLGFTFTFADATTQDVFGLVNPAGGTYAGFFGFIADKAITSVSFFTGSLTGNSELFSLDNLAFGSGTGTGGGPDTGTGGETPVPEPATFALLAGGLAIAWRFRRRQALEV